jgi:hypothetical protein
MRTRALQGMVIGSLAALLAVAPPPAGAAAPGGGDPYQRVSLALAQGLVAMFPVAEGYVVSVADGEAYVDLAEKDLMRPGMELQLYRPGAEMVHPVTKQVLGTFETDLGYLRLTEVREKYSRGGIEAAEGMAVAAGDRVRVSARRLRALLSLAGSAPGVETGPLALALLGRGAESGRFTLVDEPVWTPALAGATPQAVAGDPASLRALGERAGADLLLLATVEPGARPVVAIDVRSLRTGASLGVLREAWPGGAEPTVGAARPGQPVAAAAPAPTPLPPPSGDAPAAAAQPAAAVSPEAGEGEYVIRELPGGGRALAAGDILGEGRVEVLISDGDRLVLYRWEEKQLSWRWDEERRGGRRVVALDAADLDGDARAEVLVSTVAWGRVATEIRSWRSGKLETVGVADGLYLRAVPRPGGATLLLGQRAGIDEVLTGRVEEYRWRPGSVERVEGTALPRGVGIFGLALAPAGNPAALYSLARNSYLYAFDADGKPLWRSARTYGGYAAPLTEQDLGGGGSLTGEAFEEAMLAFQGRLLTEAAAGGVRLAVPRNFSDSPIVLTRMRSFGKGEVVLLESPPAAASLEETGRSRSFDGYIADLARADTDGDGAVEAVFLVNRFAGPLLGDRAKLVSWRLPGRPGQGK